MTVNCTFCGSSIPAPEDSDRTYQRVTGWEHRRAAGGTNHVALRKPLQEFCCYACMQKLLRGIDPQQASLLSA